MLIRLLVALLFGLGTWCLGWLAVPNWGIALLIISLLYLYLEIQTRLADSTTDVDSSPMKDDDTNIGAAAARIGASTSRIAIGSATVSHFVDKLAKVFKDQVLKTGLVEEEITNLERDNLQLIEDVEQANQRIVDADQGTKTSARELDDLLQRQATLDSSIKNTSGLLSELKEKAKMINGIVDTINQLADQTNMLALNAAIEAARAGEQGRGFAVVADEVRDLAKKTTDATQGIEQVVSQITQGSEDSAAAMEQVAAVGDEIASKITQVVEEMNRCSSYASDAASTMNQVKKTVVEHTEANQLITQNVTHLHSSVADLENDLHEVSSKATQLSVQTEDIFRYLHAFSFSDRNTQVKAIAIKAAAAIGSLFEEAVKNGNLTQNSVFDTSYQTIENTNPAKFHTQYDHFSDQQFPAIQEQIINENPFIVYAGAVDRNGYFPTHNKQFSKPLTGDYEKDLLQNRTKRIFDDPTGKRCGANTEVFLLQTYKRDTGEIMHDLCAPIFVNGQHWGNFRIGYSPED